MRLDTMVMGANIHNPTDSSRFGGGTRVLTRIMKQISELVGKEGRDCGIGLRMRGYRVMEIARLSRSKGQEQKEEIREKYGALALLTRQVRYHSRGSPTRSTADLGEGRIGSSKRYCGDKAAVGCK
jgi:hypothetical protein